MKFSLFTFSNYKLRHTGAIFQNPLADTMISPKANPQARYSAVAEAVALADAEDRGGVQQEQTTDVHKQVIRRRSQQPRPLSTFINGSADSQNLNGHNETSQPINSFQRRKARPVSMAMIAPIEAPPQCFYCLGEATHCCNWCRVVYYCGPSCYNIHRCHSKCWPFKVKGWIYTNKINIINSIAL